MNKEQKCNGKNCYGKHEAERVCSVIGRGRGKDLRVYQCPTCYWWHLTKKLSKKLKK